MIKAIVSIVLLCVLAFASFTGYAYFTVANMSTMDKLACEAGLKNTFNCGLYLGMTDQALPTQK